MIFQVTFSEKEKYVCATAISAVGLFFAYLCYMNGLHQSLLESVDVHLYVNLLPCHYTGCMEIGKLAQNSCAWW